MKNKSIMSVFYNPYKFGTWKYLKRLLYSFKLAYQRSVYGYCDLDIYDLDCYYTALMAETLKEFRETTQSHPVNCEEKEWNEKLFYIESLFRDSMRDYENPYQYYIDNSYLEFGDDGYIRVKNKLGSDEEIKGLAECYFDEALKIEKKKKELRDSAFIELLKIYDDLWS